MSEATRTRILDAAEQIFADRGFHGTSMRMVTDRARANLAAVNYHFRDKRGLYIAVLQRRLAPLNALRRDRLASAERAAGGEPVPVESVLRLYFGPLFASETDPGSATPNFRRIMGRSLSDPGDILTELLAADLHPTTARFSQALRRHTPALAPDEFLWRLSFIIGALHHTLATLHVMSALTKGICRDHDLRAAENRLVAAAAAILRAPAESPGHAARTSAL